MRNSVTAVAFALAALLAPAAPAAGQTTLDFDGVTTSQYGQIGNGYGGFDWSNFWVVNRSYAPGSGYDYGTISGEYTAYNYGGAPAEISSASSFTLASAYLTAGQTDGAEFRILGYSGAAQLFERFVTLRNNSPSLVTLNFAGVDRVRFEAVRTGSNFGYDWFAMDNATFSAPVEGTVTPEPVSMALLGTGLAGLGAVRRRRRKESGAV